MAKTNRQGKSAKEIKEISERLYGSASKSTVKKNDEPSKGIVVTKQQLDETVNRLFEKDPYQKKTELAAKAHQARENERPDNMGFQQTKDNDGIEEITKRLFIADYVNRNIQAHAPPAAENTITADELEAITTRLFIKNYANKNIDNNKAFYDSILNKKKAGEKVIHKDEWDDMVARLGKMTRDPAESNKELRGTQTFVNKGIYGTYALVSPEVCSILREL